MKDKQTYSVAYRPAVSPDLEKSRYPGFQPGVTVLKAGTVVKPGAAPLVCDLLYERDVSVTLRDGTRIYVDIYRQPGTQKVPAVIAWSPYGKRDGYILFDDFPLRAGVPQSALSGLEKFEGPDPNWWCPRGYAIIQPDSRGAYRSEGDQAVCDRQEGRDGADLIEWLATQEWCTGKIGMAGSSWLGIAQWFIAAERPPHLAAIAPWEGFNDMWRNAVGTGGVIDAGFFGWLMAPAPGMGKIEDIVKMTDEHPGFDEYWERKRAAVEVIDIPAYVGASWANVLHCMGTFEAWSRLRTPQRWLRVHNSLEWPDFYDDANQEDLCRFFDRFLRGVENGWEATPPVRLTVADFGHGDIKNRAELDFPPSRAKPRTVYLDSTTLSLADRAGASSKIEYDAEAGSAVFTLKFDTHAELLGFPQLRLFLEVDGGDDADIFVKLVKLSASGEVMGRILLPQEVPENAAQWPEIVEAAHGHLRRLYFYDGPWGRKRASHRADTDAPQAPAYHPAQKLRAGEVVEVPIAFTPTAMRIHPGESLRLSISGVNLTPHAVPYTPPKLQNKGRHVLHMGGDYPSRLILPMG